MHWLFWGSGSTTEERYGYIAIFLAILITILHNLCTANYIFIREKKKAALIRLTYMITFKKKNEYFDSKLPKELPTINIFCLISIKNWLNCRRIVMQKYKIECIVLDIEFFLIFLYILNLIIIFYLDFYGIIWKRLFLFSDKVLLYGEILDILFFIVLFIKKVKIFFFLYFSIFIL